ncbi:hypothetical protein SDC9_143957 [bioreactor metagenome]|uniref:Uncharacterized protein n=1 Tax=bioreactor metagenome TaxID=1076179 RepID=A0A645E835_9ZZZZ
MSPFTIASTGLVGTIFTSISIIKGGAALFISLLPAVKATPRPGFNKLAKNNAIVTPMAVVNI